MAEKPRCIASISFNMRSDEESGVVFWVMGIGEPGDHGRLGSCYAFGLILPTAIPAFSIVS